MFFSLILENENGDQIDMTATANNFMTSKIEGLNPPPGTVSTSSYAGMDGSYLNNAFIEKRNIVIHFEMRGVNIEQKRHLLYKVVKPSRYIKIYYSTKNIDVYATGYVETCEVSNFEEFTSGQISILCPDIYWYSTVSQMAYYSYLNGAFTFPFSIDDKGVPLGKYNYNQVFTVTNEGDETGFTLEITAHSEQENAASTFTVYNTDTDEYLQITGQIMGGDVITITTKTGNKTITLDRNGERTNIINRLVSGSTWLTMREGKNRFRLWAWGLENLTVKLIHTDAYLGV